MAIHAQITRKDLVSSDVQTRLTMFALGLLDAYGDLQDDPLVAAGAQDTTSALVYKEPISVGDANWTLVVNGFKYRRLGELMLSVNVADYSDGVMEEVRLLQSDDWRGWGRAPLKMAAASKLIGNKALAAALMGGKTAPSVENLEGSTAIKIFQTGHPCDPFGNTSKTYDNLITATPLTMPNIDAVWAKINTQPAQNGVDYRNLTWTHVVVGKDLELKARRYFENQGAANDYVRETSGTSTQDVMVANTAKPRGIKVIASPYLTEAGVWYAVCADEAGEAPWITLTQTPANTVPLIGNFPLAPAADGQGPLDPGFEWIIDDLNSQLYKHGVPGLGPKGHVAIAARRTVGAAITTPWRIFRVEPT